jgi:hypothetical protein
MLRRVDLVRTNVLEERSSSETSVLTTAIRHNIPEDGILHNHRRGNLKCDVIWEAAPLLELRLSVVPKQRICALRMLQHNFIPIFLTKNIVTSSLLQLRGPS